jgi:hypothetical protein
MHKHHVVWYTGATKPYVYQGLQPVQETFGAMMHWLLTCAAVSTVGSQLLVYRLHVVL